MRTKRPHPVSRAVVGHPVQLFSLCMGFVRLAHPLVVILEAPANEAMSGAVAKLPSNSPARCCHALVEAENFFHNCPLYRQQRTIRVFGALAPDHRVQALNGVLSHSIAATLQQGSLTQPLKDWLWCSAD